MKLQGRRELFLIQILRDSVLDRGAKRQTYTVVTGEKGTVSDTDS